MDDRRALHRPRLRSSLSLSALIGLALAAAGLVAGTSLAQMPLVSQPSASRTVAFLVQDGLRYTEERRFSEAINALEEAWERDSSSPIVAEHLALAYLYEHIPPSAEALEDARQLMRFSLASGGQVSVFAQHLHRGLRGVVSIDDHCSGELVVSSGGIHYRTTLTEHSFSFGSEELKSIEPAKSKQLSSAGGLVLRARDGKRHHIRTGTHSRAEAEIVLQLTREVLTEPGG